MSPPSVSPPNTRRITSHSAQNSPSRPRNMVSASFSGGTEKQRREPSVTPRKFKRFFTPRNLNIPYASSARQALEDITRPSLNLKSNKSSPVRSPRVRVLLDSSPPELFTRRTKRRKKYHTPQPSEPPPGLPDQKQNQFLGTRNDEFPTDMVPSSPCERAAMVSYMGDGYQEENQTVQHLIGISPVRNRGLAGQLLGRSYASSMRIERQNIVYPVNDWQHHTASFYSRASDVHISMSLEGRDRTIPFCAAACNTNSLVAIGDEEGRVRLLESTDTGEPVFKDVFLGFRVHKNAIIDMTFSDDDTRLVTASGDQSSRVVDMTTQTTISILGVHTASLKQARFQPGSSNNVIATSSRDGSIQLWDLRCKGYDTPLAHIYVPVETARHSMRSEKVHYGAVVNSIYDAHKAQTYPIPAMGIPDSPTRGETAGRLGDVSVTAIQFLSSELNHLLLSASEADSSVKLWDIRQLQKSRRRRYQMALSSTMQPQSHSRWRHFGVSSMNLSSDGSRLYTLCKDNTVYAYSTAHLILGQAPELEINGQGRPRPIRPAREGLGPVYGFRHTQLHATSFYVKSAIRPPKDGRCEMLAVGSSDGCAVLFPTAERYISQDQQKANFRPAMKKASSRLEDSIPISMNGTALVRGHDREVGSLAWTSEGGLITVGDDFLVRAWREGPEARDLRLGGEGEGRRWGCGWADIGAQYDEDDA